MEPDTIASILKGMASWLISCGLFKFWDSPPHKIYSFATPLQIGHDFHHRMLRIHNACCQALRGVASRLREDPERAKELLRFESRLEEEFFFLDNGYKEALPFCRSDMAVSPEGELWVLEMNTGCPGGELDPVLVAQAYRETVQKEAFGETFFDPRDESLEAILECYREFRRSAPLMPEIPTIALVTSLAQARFLLPESIGIADHYRERGFRVLVGDLGDVGFGDGGIVICDTPVQLIYRKFSTTSFKLRLEQPWRFEEKEARGARLMWEAIASSKVCLVNPLSSTFFQDKGLLEVVREEFPQMKELIPETFILDERLEREHPELVEEIRVGGSFIIKKRKSFSGRHVIMDRKNIQEELPMILRTEPGKWVAQRRIQLSDKWFAAYHVGRVCSGYFPFVLSPFGLSAFVRVGLSGDMDAPINAHKGSAETFLLVSE